ncbi:MAG: hypothetical protein Kow0098_17970 [Ignavibacteriaceae bacterium]
MLVIGQGRFGSENYFLGKEGSNPDPVDSSTPVFATGVINYTDSKRDITIHSEQDEMIEIDLSLSGRINSVQPAREISRWSLSYWNPGENSVSDNSPVREINLKTSQYILAVSPSEKRLWMHEFSTGINHLIALTNFYSELMAVKKIKDPSVALKPALFFEHLNDFSDAELAAAFLMYNKYMRRFNIDFRQEDVSKSLKTKKTGFHLFRRKKS